MVGDAPLMRGTVHVADAWDATQRVPPSELVVAVSPGACADLARLGQACRTIDDFYHADDVVAGEQAYWQEQLAWVEALDGYLAAHVPMGRLGGIQPAQLYFYCLKQAVDQLFICRIQLQGLLNAVRPERIVLHTRFRDTSCPLNHTLHYPLGSHHRLLLPQLCAEAAIVCDVVPVLNRRSSADRQDQWHRTTMRLTAAAERRWRRFITRWREPQRTGESRPHHLRTPLTFVATGCWGEMARFITDACRRGHRGLRFENGVLFEATTNAGKRKMAMLGDSTKWWSSRGGLEAWSEAAQHLKESREICRWIENRCGASVLAFVLPQLEYFVAHVAPRIVSSANQLSDVFREHRVNALVNTGLTTIDDAAAIAAAQQASCPAYYVMHGEGAWETVVWQRDSQLYDAVFARHGEVARYYSTWRDPDTVRIGSYELAQLDREQRWTTRARRRQRPLLVFASVAMDYWYLHLPFVSPTWYFELQRRLVDLFVQRSDYRVIYKSSPGFIYHEAIASYIADQHAKYVRIDTRPFVEWLPRAERVVIDVASTIVSECLANGKPIHVLCHRGFAMRPTMRTLLEGHVSDFTTHDEAIEALARYLDGPAKIPPKLELASQTTCEQLETIVTSGRKPYVPREQVSTRANILQNVLTS